MRLYDETIVEKKAKKRCCSCLVTLLQITIFTAILIAYNYHCYKYFTQIRIIRCEDKMPPLRKNTINTTIEPESKIEKVKSNECHSKNCIEKLFRGEPIKINDNTHKEYELSIVISYSCGDDISTFYDYLSDWRSKGTITIRTMTFLCRCPNKCPTDLPKNVEMIQSKEMKYPDLNYITWLTSQLQPTTQSYLTSNDNHFILFLNSRSFSLFTNTLQEVIQMTVENGFGCIQKSPTGTQSVYHDWKTLMTFTPPTSQSGPYKNFGSWVNTFSFLEDKDLVPVCYGGSFMMKSYDLVSKSEHYYLILKELEGNLENDGSRREVTEYIERFWSSIFSYPLDQEVIAEIRKYSSKVSQEVCCSYTGALLKN